MHGVIIYIHTFCDPIRSIRRLLMIIACMLPYCLLQRDEGIIVMTKETTAAPEETRPQPVSMNDSYVNDDAVDSDSISSMDDDDDEDDFDDDEEGDVRGGGSGKMQYEIQFQRQQQNNQSGGGGVRPNGSGGASAGPAATASGSFLTMVHH